MLQKIVLTATTLMLLVGCKNSDTLLPNISGGAYEILVVMDNDDWKSEGGRAVYDMLDRSVPQLPQSEPMFKISRVEHQAFTDILHPARNILMVEMGDAYTTTKLRFYNSRWAKYQALAVVSTPCSDSLKLFIQQHEAAINNYFVDAEMRRQQRYFHTSRNTEAEHVARDSFNIELIIPSFIKLSKPGKDFLWVSNGNLNARQDIVIYAVPYVSLEQWQLPTLLNTRDSVMRCNMPGSKAGSWMGIEREVLPPTLDTVSVDGHFACCVRGLWKMIDGDIMGGPFVSHTILDEANQRLITIEGFVFAPSRDKRNLLRQLEAVVRSAHIADPQQTEQTKQ
ncbi:MAG: DUF4837 family protein [Bacteroidales bacterium]|nr:DUF4837 family protein [Bacteroidales bacterium]